MTLATEIIADLVGRMEKANKAVGEALMEIDCIREKLGLQYKEDREYLDNVKCENGTKSE